MIEHKKRFYSKLELAMELNVCIRTIDNWMCAGLISYSKMGKRVVFSEVDLDEFITRNRKSAFAFEGEESLLHKVNIARSGSGTTSPLS